MNDFLTRLCLAPKLLSLGQPPKHGAEYEFDPHHPLGQGLEGWWLFNEGAGTKTWNIAKRTTQEFTGIAPTDWGTGPMGGNSLFVPSSGAYINFGNDQNFNFDWNEPFTFCAWLNATGSPDYVAAKMFGSAPFRGWFIRNNSGKARYYLRHTSSPTSYLGVTTKSVVFSSGVWRHACISYDGSGTVAGVDIEIDGALVPVDVNSDTLDGNTTLTDGPFNLFARDRGNTYGGYAADIRIFRRKLAPPEARRVYLGEMPLRPRTPAFWPAAVAPGFVPPANTLRLSNGRFGEWSAGDAERVLAQTEGRLEEVTTLTNPVITLANGRRVEV